jgi:hypothetical protein
LLFPYLDSRAHWRCLWRSGRQALTGPPRCSTRGRQRPSSGAASAGRRLPVPRGATASPDARQPDVDAQVVTSLDSSAASSRRLDTWPLSIWQVQHSPGQSAQIVHASASQVLASAASVSTAAAVRRWPRGASVRRVRQQEEHRVQLAAGLHHQDGRQLLAERDHRAPAWAQWRATVRKSRYSPARRDQ